MSSVKGFKCKFSHDLAVERKAEKIDLFSDRRAAGESETSAAARCSSCASAC